MTIPCPNCATPYPLDEAEIGPAGRMVACFHCGTRWLARAYSEDPYRRGDFGRPAMQPVDVSDAIVIEDIGPGFAKRRAGSRRSQSERRPSLPSDRRWLKGVGAVLGVAIAVFVLGVPLVAALPELSPSGLPAESGQLAFDRVHSETMLNHGVKTLVVEGELVNRSDSDAAVPAIRVSLRSAGGAEVYSWLVEPTAAGLAPGRSIGFRSAIASPPAEASQVALRLAARENQIIGMR